MLRSLLRLLPVVVTDVATLHVSLAYESQSFAPCTSGSNGQLAIQKVFLYSRDSSTGKDVTVEDVIPTFDAHDLRYAAHVEVVVKGLLLWLVHG